MHDRATSRKQGSPRQAGWNPGPVACLSPMRPLLASALLSALMLALSPASADEHADAPPDEAFTEYVPGAARLEGRLLAPCCWDSSRQTLDIHGSPIANELRREIRSRLKAGETPDAVEADLVRRYTTKILAAPLDSPIAHLGTLLSFGLLSAGGLAAVLVVRWRRHASAPKKADEKPAKDRDEWDQRLDDELREPDGED
jgi:cytochrome c-type biogenesis protein CcmH